VRMPWLTILLAAACLVGCQTTATENNPTPSVGDAAANPGKTNPADTDGGDGPLRLDSPEALALLGVDDALKPADPADSEKAVSNARCLVCHGNFAHEELSVIHARNGVGCERCHGSSDAHCADENNITPPEIMYPRDTIVKSCMGCHPADKLSHKEHHWDVFAPKNGTPKKMCTDCHGKHRIASRDVRWNRKTGELLKGGWMDERKE